MRLRYIQTERMGPGEKERLKMGDGSGKGNIRKNKQMELHQTKKFLYRKGNQQNKKTTDCLGEDIR